MSRRLWQYYRDEKNETLTDSESFKSRVEIAGSSHNNGNTKKVKIPVSLNYFSNFWRTLGMSLINYEIIFILTWSSTCATTNSAGKGTLAITHTKLYVPVVALSTRDNEKMLKQLRTLV